MILNAAAGSGDDATRAEELAQRFRASGMDVRVTLVRSGEEITAASRRAIAGRPPLVVAAGGDGTIAAVASVLAGTQIALGILPLGTLNHFAKDARIPLDAEEAVRNIIAGHRVQVDVGDVNGRAFLNNSSLGIYPDIVTLRERQQRLGRSKWASAVRATLATLRRYPFMSVRLTLQGREHTRRTAFVFVGNNEYETAGLGIGGRQRLDSGLLSLYVGHRVGRWGLLRLVLRAIAGRLRQAKDFDALTATEILIESPHRQLQVAADGEVAVMSTPLRYHIRPGALRVIVPEAA